MAFNTLATLETNNILLRKLELSDYDELYKVASNPLLWQHHPIANPYESAGFKKFFNDALQVGSLCIIDKSKNAIIGCTRFYNYNALESSIVIGHTFIAQEYWGTGINKSIKKLMLDYAFTQVNKVIFYVVEENIRSQKAPEKLGAVAIDKIIRTYDGKQLRCLVYQIKNVD